MKHVISVIVIGAAIILPFFMNCSDFSQPDGSSAASTIQSNCPANFPIGSASPKTIDDAVSLINSLPKPLAINCFISALASPFSVFATNNFFSAQPSAGYNNPRILIIYGNLIMTFVPEGPDKNLMEVSQIIFPGSSVKGEIQFPVSSQLPIDTPYSRILNGTSGTKCTICHAAEQPYPAITTGLAFQSGLVRPDPAQRVSSSYMKNQAINCDGRADLFRCQMLKAIFIDGQGIDGTFP